MKQRLRQIRTLLALGPVNLARVGLYRLGLKTGLHPVLRVEATAPQPPFFTFPSSPPSTASPLEAARRTWQSSALYFGAHEFPLAGIPDWHANPFRPGARAQDSRHWSQIPDFDAATGDIKTVWEASRFDWLLAMAQRAALGDTGEAERLQAWLADWSAKNPPFRGANWKCGQEASIRVMHLAAAAIILDQVEAPAPGLLALVRNHLARIAPTMSYALGQQNNHGTSEAAAMFIGGSWLALNGDPQAMRWRDTGRRWLEERATALIAEDGTFSQYSTVYHRVMLDSYSLAEVWRRKLAAGKDARATGGFSPFSTALYDRLRAATRWLHALTDPGTGDVANLGANDGARLIPLTDTDFRDFRPSLQLAALLFCKARAIAAEGPWDQPAIWFGLEPAAQTLAAPMSESFDNGGLHVLCRGDTVALLRYPRFRFRPSQADALHLDLWLGGSNILRDAGSYSYNVSDADTRYFNGTAAHNSVAFDGRDQMPRLGRFLFGEWLKARNVAPVAEKADAVDAAAGYRDYLGAEHHRHVSLERNRLICRDRLSGQAQKAVLRWRLAPGDWTLTPEGASNGAVTIRLSGNGARIEPRLTTGWESRYYLQKTELPVLEVEVAVPAQLTTEVIF